MADSEEQEISVVKDLEIRGFIDARIENILKRYDCVADKDIIEELVAGFEKDLLMKTRKIVFRFSIEKVKVCIKELERELGETKEGSDASTLDPDERAAPACAHMDQWELVPRRKKKYFASDTLDLFKFYDGQTDTFPKSCVRKCELNRPGSNTVCASIVEVKFPIPQFEPQMQNEEAAHGAEIDLGDSILDEFASAPIGESTVDPEEKEDSPEEEADEQEDAGTPAEQVVIEVSEGPPQSENATKETSADVPTSTGTQSAEGNSNPGEESEQRRPESTPIPSTDRATDTCTAEDIEMSVRRANEEASPVVRRYEFEHFIEYINAVLDEYNNRLRVVEGWKSPVDKRVGAIEAITFTKLTELEMGQAGVIDEMGRMRLDLTDVDVRTARNTRDIGIHYDPPEDKRKNEVFKPNTMESIWDIESENKVQVTGNKNVSKYEYKGYNRQGEKQSRENLAGNDQQVTTVSAGTRGVVAKQPPPTKQQQSTMQVTTMSAGTRGAVAKQPPPTKQQQSTMQKKGSTGKVNTDRQKVSEQPITSQGPIPQRSVAFNGARPKVVVQPPTAQGPTTQRGQMSNKEKPKVGVQPPMTQDPKPQRSIIESFGRITRGAASRMAESSEQRSVEKEDNPIQIPSDATPVKEVQEAQGATGDTSWVDEISDEDIISCLDETESTFEVIQAPPNVVDGNERNYGIAVNNNPVQPVNNSKKQAQGNGYKGPVRKKQNYVNNRTQNMSNVRNENNKSRGSES